MNYGRIINTLEYAASSLKVIDGNGLNYYPKTRAVIQTNGILFSKLGDIEIEDIVQKLAGLLPDIGANRIVFELSFKSANDADTLDKQVGAFNILVDKILTPLWGLGLSNIAVYPVAGLGPTVDSGNDWLIPVDSASLPDEIPLFHPSTWAQPFKGVISRFTGEIVPAYNAYSDFRMNPLSSSGRKIAIEELEAPRFQVSWISGYAGGYANCGVEVPPLNTILRKKSGTMNAQWRALCYRTQDIPFPERIATLNQIPVATNPAQLVDEIARMKYSFYPSHPLGHYPYL